MTNTKKLFDSVRVNFKIERTELMKLKENGINNKSEFLRQCIYNYNKNNNNNIKELQQELTELKHKKELINNEITILKKQISDIEKREQENKNNDKLISEIMDDIKLISSNENGITRDRIKKICDGKIDYLIILNKCREDDIKIISGFEIIRDKNTNERINSKIVEDKIKPKEPLEQVISIFKRHFKAQYKYTNEKDFLKNNETTFITICQKKKIDYDTFKNDVIK